MPKADPFAQRRLLDLAGLDQSINAAEHRRATLPELSVIAVGQARLDELRTTAVLAQTEVDDLTRSTRKLDNEIDQVRSRADRDAKRLAAGAGNAKDLESLQHEITSLARRQAVLEDEALELMERKETADAALSGVTVESGALQEQVTAAQQRRDALFAGIDGDLATHRRQRAELVAALPPDLVATYERVHRSGKVAAARLTGGRCDACRIDLDRVELTGIAAAASDEIIRCPECGAILIRW